MIEEYKKYMQDFIDMDLVPLERLGQLRGKGLRLPGDKLRMPAVREQDKRRLNSTYKIIKNKDTEITRLRKFTTKSSA